jgi:E3 ubiquitin-protein ligase TRIP12
VACRGFSQSNTLVVVTVKKRQEILVDAFACRRARGVSFVQSPLSTLVKKLQESLTRMESFDVVTVAQGADGQ